MKRQEAIHYAFEIRNAIYSYIPDKNSFLIAVCLYLNYIVNCYS